MSYRGERLNWNGRNLHFGKRVIPMQEAGLDHTPGDVAEVRLLRAKQKRDRRDDAAVIALREHTHTPVQEFVGDREFAETGEEGLVWVGQEPNGETMTYCPSTTVSLQDHKSTGHIRYGKGYVGSWINTSGEMRTFLELCMPAFSEDGGVVEHPIDDHAIDLRYWKMWHAVKGDLA